MARVPSLGGSTRVETHGPLPCPMVRTHCVHGTYTQSVLFVLDFRAHSWDDGHLIGHRTPAFLPWCGTSDGPEVRHAYYVPSLSRLRDAQAACA
jgi:hypothetical protein